MLEKPISAYPYINTIDAAVDNEFLFTFSGDVLSKYAIIIYDLADNTAKYTGAAITPHSRVYRGDEVKTVIPGGALQNGKSYYWRATMYQDAFDIFITSGRTSKAATNSTSVIIGVGITTIQTGMKLLLAGSYYTISSYNKDTGALVVETAVTAAEKAQYYIYADHLVSASFSFTTRAAPLVSLPPIANPYKNRSVALTGSYAQHDGTHIKYHRWDLFDHNGSLIDSTGNIYNENLSYTFDGLIANTRYTVSLSGETQDGVGFSTGRIPINVQYDAPTMQSPPGVSVVDNESAICVDVNGIDQFVGQDSGSNQFGTEAGKPYVEIMNGTISADLSLGEIERNEFYVQLKTRLDLNSINDIIELGFSDGSLCRVSFTGREFVYHHHETQTTVLALYSESRWCMTPDGIAQPGICYEWDDGAMWDDSMRWTESAVVTDVYIIGLSDRTCHVKGADW